MLQQYYRHLPRTELLPKVNSSENLLFHTKEDQATLWTSMSGPVDVFSDFTENITKQLCGQVWQNWKKTILHFIEKEVNRIRRMVIVAVVTLVEKVRHLQQVVSLGNMWLEKKNCTRYECFFFFFLSTLKELNILWWDSRLLRNFEQPTERNHRNAKQLDVCMWVTCSIKHKDA